jgi:hypothetical protein
LRDRIATEIYDIGWFIFHPQKRASLLKNNIFEVDLHRWSLMNLKGK